MNFTDYIKQLDLATQTIKDQAPMTAEEQAELQRELSEFFSNNPIEDMNDENPPQP